MRLRRDFGRFGWWHWQNLDEDRTTGEHERYGERRLKGNGWRNGRAWVNRRCPDNRMPAKLGVQWVLLQRQLSIFDISVEASPSGEDDLAANVTVWPCALYVSVDAPWAAKVARFLTPKGYDEREISLALSAPSRCGGMGEGFTLRWRLWAPNMSWSSKTPKWRDGYWNPITALLGRHVYSKQDISTVDAIVPMPERAYPARVTIFDSTWHRKRFPFIRKTLRRAEVDIPGGIGHPGKGENAWDCGDDAMFSITCPARTVEEAIGAAVESVSRDRMKNGGSYAFEPSEMAAD